MGRLTVRHSVLRVSAEYRKRYKMHNLYDYYQGATFL
jgi:hypothetical protein